MGPSYILSYLGLFFISTMFKIPYTGKFCWCNFCINHETALELHFAFKIFAWAYASLCPFTGPYATLLRSTQYSYMYVTEAKRQTTEPFAIWYWSNGERIPCLQRHLDSCCWHRMAMPAWRWQLLQSVQGSHSTRCDLQNIVSANYRIQPLMGGSSELVLNLNWWSGYEQTRDSYFGIWKLACKICEN